MTIQETINVHLKNAILTSNKEVKDLLRVVIGEFNRVDKVVTDEKATSIIKKMIENAKLIGNGGEVLILETYLPKQLSEDQVKMLVAQLAEDKKYTSIKDMGKIMNDLKVEYAGRYDGKLASNYIKEFFTAKSLDL